MPQMSIIVEYEINEGSMEDFSSLIRDHARRTLAEEPGCLRFEILQPVDDTGQPIVNRMMVSELYADETAARAHGNRPRLNSLRSALGHLVKSRKQVTARVENDDAEDSWLTTEEINASNDN